MSFETRESTYPKEKGGPQVRIGRGGHVVGLRLIICSSFQPLWWSPKYHICSQGRAQEFLA